MRVILGFGPAVFGSAVTATARAAEPADSLARLEARAAQENRGPAPAPGFQRDLTNLIEHDALASGEDFFRAARLATAPLPSFRSARTAYELTLAAVASGHVPAETALADAWNSLLGALGRPLRFDIMGLMSPGGEAGAAGFDPAGAAAAAVLRDPTAGRTRADQAADNDELKAILSAAPAVPDTASGPAPLGAAADADRLRIARVRALAAAGGLRTRRDFLAAAELLERSVGFADLQLAHEFALCALLLGDRAAAPQLAASTYDRLLNAAGYDQRFGTQRVAPAPGHPALLRPVDESGISDAERRTLGCAPLAEHRSAAPRPSS